MHLSPTSKLGYFSFKLLSYYYKTAKTTETGRDYRSESLTDRHFLSFVLPITAINVLFGK